MNDALIVGGGLAGSSLAIHLLQAGRSVLLLEKEMQAHHKVCGEFMSAEGAAYLEQLGIDLKTVAALPISKVRLARQYLLAETALPFNAYSISRFNLDQTLLERAVNLGAKVERGVRVQSLGAEDGSWTARHDGSRYTGKTAFLANGKHDLYGWPRPDGQQPNLIGFKMHWRLSAQVARELADAIELILFPGGYAGLQMITPEIANLGLLVRKSEYRRVGGSWSSLLRHMQENSRHLEARIGDAEPLWPAPLAISPIPYGHLHRHDDGPWRLGDQAAVIPSFAGSGMSIALHTSSLAAKWFLRGESARRYYRNLASDLKQRIFLSTLLSKAIVSRPLVHVVEQSIRVLPPLLNVVAAGTRIPTVSLGKT